MSENLNFDPETNKLTVSHVDGVEYRIGGKVIEGSVILKKNTTVRARPKPGYVFPRGATTEWTFEVSENPEKVEDESGEDETVSDPDPVSDQSAGNTPESVGQQTSNFGS